MSRLDDQSLPWLKVNLRQIVVVAMEWIEHESKLGTL